MIKHLILQKIQNTTDINTSLFQWFINLLINSQIIASGGSVNIVPNKELAKELHKPIIKKFEKRKVHSSSIANTWGTDLAETQLLSKFNKGIRFLLFVIDIFSKHAWVVP